MLSNILYTYETDAASCSPHGSPAAHRIPLLGLGEELTKLFFTLPVLLCDVTKEVRILLLIEGWVQLNLAQRIWNTWVCGGCHLDCSVQFRPPLTFLLVHMHGSYFWTINLLVI